MKLLLLALLGLTAPVPVVVGPEKPVRPGHNIRVSVNPPQTGGNTFNKVTYTWLVHPEVEDLEVDRLDGTRAFFGSGEDEADYTITLIATYTYADFVAKKVDTVTATAVKVVQVRRTGSPVGPPPQPPPDPPPGPPDPPPAPTFPPGEFGLSQATYDAVIKLQMDPAKRSAQAQALAANYGKVVDTIKSMVAAGSPVTAKNIIGQTVALNQATLGTDGAIWKPALDQIAALANTQKAKFATINDWINAWTEIKIALEAIK